MTRHTVGRQYFEYPRRVTVGALKAQVTVGKRELLVGELGVSPGEYGVTVFTCKRKVALQVPGGVLVIARMAGYAIRGDAVEGPGDVALLARDGSVSADQREDVVVDGDVTPVPSAVTTLAVLRKVAGHVRRSVHEVRLVTEHAIGRQRFEHRGRVALLTGDPGMPASERKVAVVEVRIDPQRGIMALRTVGAEPSGGVIRSSRRIEVLTVTRDAIRGLVGIAFGFVARTAFERAVSTGQGEAGPGVIESVEADRRPCDCCMTC